MKIIFFDLKKKNNSTNENNQIGKLAMINEINSILYIHTVYRLQFNLTFYPLTIINYRPSNFYL